MEIKGLKPKKRSKLAIGASDILQTSWSQGRITAQRVSDPFPLEHKNQFVISTERSNC